MLTVLPLTVPLPLTLRSPVEVKIVVPLVVSTVPFTLISAEVRVVLSLVVSIQEFVLRLDEYLHWYAEKRIKLSLGGLSPVQYRTQLGLI